MSEILFVHGTGVRRVAYDNTFQFLRKQAAKYLNHPESKVHTCIWGEPYGAKLRLDGASIPTYDEQDPKLISARQAAEIDAVTWRLLREDPLFELRLLESLPGEKKPLAPGQVAPGATSLKLVTQLQPPAEFVDALRYHGLADFWPAAYQDFIGRPELQRILLAANRDPREISRTLARGLIAGLVTHSVRGQHEELITAPLRESLIEMLIPHLGGQPLGVFDWITKPLTGLAKKFGTYKARRARRALSDSSYPAAGDIVLYQARGEKIRTFIKDAITDERMPGEVVIFAHSLGGIAVIDLLAQHDFGGKVIGLVTVGSQAPFLYEIGALTSLEFGTPLPPFFPKKWLNFWDPNDFLSYSAELVFGKNSVTDIMVESGMPFPDSHSAYWDQAKTWNTIKNSFPWA